MEPAEWHDDVIRDDGVQCEKEAAGTKRGNDLRGTERGSENKDYWEEIERNAITKMDFNKGKRGDPREKTLVPDCRDEERRAEKPATLLEERDSHRHGIA
ncbi:hypothetical protein NDU88_000828 [Pleurodeles waltl]|uniref:Uncharacterized protein n=1 Tax=Pleurodeles waltl TaxID=8319 RepID=A0AAV7UR47_PLEWA|nr:hypothetical protein NDU88_000828 [Pleurodeles waltl]